MCVGEPAVSPVFFFFLMYKLDLIIGKYMNV